MSTILQKGNQTALVHENSPTSWTMIIYYITTLPLSSYTSITWILLLCMAS